MNVSETCLRNLFFFLLSVLFVNSPGQKSPSGISLGNNNKVINSILVNGNYNNTVQINIKDPSACQEVHLANYWRMVQKFNRTLRLYEAVKDEKYLITADSIYSIMDLELDALTTCDFNKKLSQDHPALNCPYDYLDKADFLYGNLDFLNALLWYAEAISCIKDKDLFAKTDLKIKTCKRKLLNSESFLSSYEYSTIRLTDHKNNGGWLSIQSKFKKENEIVSIIQGVSRNSEYKIPYSILVHDTFGNIINFNPLNEIEYNNVRHVQFLLLPNDDILFGVKYFGDTLKLLLYDQSLKLKKIKAYTTTSVINMAMGDNVIGVLTSTGITCLDFNLNMLYEIKENFAGEWRTQDGKLSFSNLSHYNFSGNLNLGEFTIKSYLLNYERPILLELTIARDTNFPNIQFRLLTGEKILITRSGSNTQNSKFEIYKSGKLINSFLYGSSEGISSLNNWRFIGYEAQCAIFSRQYLNYKTIHCHSDTLYLNTSGFGSIIHSGQINCDYDFVHQTDYQTVNTNGLIEWYHANTEIVQRGKEYYLKNKIAHSNIHIPNLTLGKYYYRANLRNPEEIKYFAGRKIINSNIKKGVYWIYISTWNKWLSFTGNFTNPQIQLYENITDAHSLSSREFPKGIEVTFPGYFLGDYSGVPCLIFSDTGIHQIGQAFTNCRIQLIDSNLNNIGRSIIIKDLRIEGDQRNNRYVEFIQTVNTLGDFIIVSLHFKGLIAQRVYNKNGDYVDSMTYLNRLDYLGSYDTLIINTAFVNKYYYSLSDIDYNRMPFSSIPLLLNENGLFLYSGFIPIKIVKCGKHYIVGGHNDQMEAQFFILDSNFNVLHKTTPTLFGSSLVNKIIAINDTLFAIGIEEGTNSPRVFEDEMQSYIFLVAVSGEIIAQRNIKTFGINTLKNMTFDVESGTIDYIGTTTHFRIINGLVYDDIHDLDFYIDHWKLP